MTVSYSGDAYSVEIGVYWRLLFRYRGSAWKLAYPEVAVFSMAYAFLSLIYRLLLEDPMKRWFELAVISVARILDQIPIGFILGFYVSLIYGRFWKQFIGIPYTTKLAALFTTYIRGKDEKTVVLRRTVMRYVAVAWAIAFRTMNIPIKKRFPTERHLVDAGLLTEAELAAFEKTRARRLDACFFVPLSWCASLVERAYRMKLIQNEAAFVDIVSALDELRKALQLQCTYDMVNVPLVYTQAVIFGTYSFFLAGTIGYQFIPAERLKQLVADGYRTPPQFTGMDLFVPTVAVVQVFIYAGLFKVAESLLNPHGENDDDFDICSHIDKNLVNGYLIVTDMHDDVPELQRDPYWNTADVNIPYTQAANELRERRPNPDAHFGSLFDFSILHGTEFLTHLSPRSNSQRAATAADASLEPKPN